MSIGDDQEWLTWRRGGIGASDVANAMAGTYGGGYGVVADKLGLLTQEPPTAEQQRGHDWETRIADMVDISTGLWVYGEQAWCTHPEYSHHRATIDGLLGEGPHAESLDDMIGVLEIKTRGTHAPRHYERHRLQCQWQMHVTEMPMAILAVATIDDVDDTLIGLHVETVDRDEFVIADLITLADDLWGYVGRNELPDPDAPSALDVARAVYSDATVTPKGDEVDLDDLADVVARRCALKDAIAEATEEMKLIDARLMERVGHDTTGVTSLGHRVSWSAPSNVLDDAGADALLIAHPELAKTVLDRDAAKKLYPDEYDDMRVAVGARRFSVRPPKE